MKVLNNLLERTRLSLSLLTTLVGSIGVLSFLMFVILVVMLCTLFSCTDGDATGNGTDRPTAAALTPLGATALLPQASGSGSIGRNAANDSRSITRAFAPGSNLTGLTLYYPAGSTGTGSGSSGSFSLSTYYPADADITQAGGADGDFSFTTTRGSKTGSGSTPTPLYWQQIAGTGVHDASFYLTVVQTEDAPADANPGDADTENILWGACTTTGTGNADQPRRPLAFGTLKSRLARFTLMVKCKGGEFPLSPALLKAFVYTVPRAGADEASSTGSNGTGGGITRQAWPTTGTAPVMNPLITPVDATTNATSTPNATPPRAAFTGTRLIAPQALPAGTAGTAGQNDGNLLVIRYNIAEDADGNPVIQDGQFTPSENKKPCYLWTLNLSTVSVRRDAGSEFASGPASTTDNGFAYGTAFGYNPGEHITLTVVLSLTHLTPGDGILSQIKDYEASAANEEIEVPVSPRTVHP